MHVPTLLLGDMSLRAVHSLHMFPERAGVCVALGAARDFAYIRFLANSTKKKLLMNGNKSDYDLAAAHLQF